MKNNAWMLPEGIDEAGPEQAEQSSDSGANALIECALGLQLIMPPMVEFTESLLTGAGAELSRP